MSDAMNLLHQFIKASLVSALLLASCLLSAEEFTIRDIRVQGLNKVSEGAVINSLPVRMGQTINEEDFSDIISALYEEGFFSDIKLAKDADGVLVIEVVERPSIKSITLKGNRVLKTEPLLDGLAAAGLAENKTFNPSVLENLRQELLRQYVSQGMQGTVIDAQVKEAKDNSVDVVIKIKESSAAKIKRISFTGNTAFSDSQLKDLMELRDKTGIKFWSKKNRYLRPQLNADLSKIESHYLNSGYLKFAIESAQVNIDSENKGVVVDIAINEGPVFTIDQLKFLSQDVNDTAEIDKSLSSLKGKKYSQKDIAGLEEIIQRLLGAQGYAFARVRGIPKFKENQNMVDVIFAIEKGKRSYVRRISFTGNTKTQDHVLRREMRQLESAPANTALIEQSRLRLQRLGFFKDVQVSTIPVAGHDDLVDVNFTVEEEFSGSVSASLGFADGSGLQVGGNLQQNNFMGTGQSVNVGLNRSKYETRVNFGVTNPYYTKDGVSRGFNVFYNKRNLDEVGVSSYSVDKLGANMNFGYPLSETQRVGFGVGYEKTDITTGDAVVQEISNSNETGFVDVHGKSYDLVNLNAHWRQSSLNRGRFATKGSSQTLRAEATVPGGDLEYYKVTYDGQRFFPVIADGFAIRARTKLGYGGSYGDTEKLPFFENYYAGGFNSVRGFDQNSLGPKSTPAGATTTVAGADPFGGNVAVEVGADFIFPVPFIKNNRTIQTSLFVDAGNVFDTDCGATQADCTPFKAKEIRASAGIGVNWHTIVGPMSFSLSQPIKHKEGVDDTKKFQFSIGTSF